MKAVVPIIVVDLFPQLHRELMALLRSLSDEAWGKPTAARAWLVKDIAAHLLDGTIRRLSFQRDHTSLPQPPSQIENYKDLVAFINGNANFENAGRHGITNILLLNMQTANLISLMLATNSSDRSTTHCYLSSFY